MRRTKIEIALPVISTYFNNLPTKIFGLKELFTHLTNSRGEWDLSKSTTSRVLIEYLIHNSKLKKMDFPFPYRHETRYVWGNISLFEVLVTLQNNCYFSHQTAMYFNELTSDIPLTIYLNHEQSPRPQSGSLMQKSIDNAFRNPPRKSNNVIENEQFNICMVNGMNTNQLGVISKVISNIKPKANVRITNIERTLIDITVRPVYSGGVEAVKHAYALAKDKVSIEVLRDMYLKLKYQYPYHQAIGYYLESTNYSPALIYLFQSLPMEFDFHLTNQMKEPLYIEKWKLYVPNNKIKDV
jgi:hypothetical protein